MIDHSNSNKINILRQELLFQRDLPGRCGFARHIRILKFYSILVDASNFTAMSVIVIKRHAAS